MAAQPLTLGDRLADDASVFRAFAVEGYRHRKKNKVRRKAFYRTKDHADGLSVGMSPEHAVAGLAVNYGYCSIRVGPVHQLPHGLEVRPDLDSQGHALLLNLPFIDGTDQEREMAEVIAGQLVKIAQVVTCDCFPPRPAAAMPNL
jgi:hypothetical protein